MLTPLFKIKLRNAAGKYSVGIPKEIGEQLKGRTLELTVEDGRIQIAEPQSLDKNELIE